MAIRDVWNIALKNLDSTTLLAFTVTVIIIHLAVGSRRAHLDHIPGPFLARYTNLHAWFYAQWNWGKNVCYLRSLHELYGDVIRVGPRRVSVSNPEAIQIIYNIKASLSKSELIRAAQPLGKGPENLFSVRDSASHAQMRRPVANAYSVSTIMKYEPRIDETLRTLFNILKTQGPEINLGQWVHYCKALLKARIKRHERKGTDRLKDVYDNAGNVTYAQPLGYLEQGGDPVGLIKQTKLLHRYINCTMPMPALHDVASFFIRMFKAHSYTAFFLLSQQKVRERLQKISMSKSEGYEFASKSDILAHFLSSREKFPELMTEDQIITHCMVNVVAGIGTSTTSTNNVLKYLIANRPAQARLYHELRTANVQFPVSWRKVQALPFLDSLIREGIRLRSPDTFNPNGRVVGHEGMELPGGIYLPPQTIVGIKPSVASIQERTFGAYPYEFRPERWLQRESESDSDFAERRARMDRGDMSFSSGSRSCIGKGIAMMQIFKLVASVVCRYELLPAKTAHPSQSNLDAFCKLQPRMTSM